VVEVGPGDINHQGNIVPLQVKVGDSVLLPEYGG
jgi:co-chaperonin GroES (HSP10)